MRDKGLPTIAECPIITASFPRSSMPVDSMRDKHAFAVHGATFQFSYASLPILAGFKPSASLSGAILEKSFFFVKYWTAASKGDSLYQVPQLFFFVSLSR